MRAVRLTHASVCWCVCVFVCVQDRYASGSPFETYIHLHILCGRASDRRTSAQCNVLMYDVRQHRIYKCIYIYIRKYLLEWGTKTVLFQFVCARKRKRKIHAYCASMCMCMDIGVNRRRRAGMGWDGGGRKVLEFVSWICVCTQWHRAQPYGINITIYTYPNTCTWKHPAVSLIGANVITHILNRNRVIAGHAAVYTKMGGHQSVRTHTHTHTRSPMPFRPKRRTDKANDERMLMPWQFS